MPDTGDMHWTELVRQAIELDETFPFAFGELNEDDRHAASLAAVETFWGHGFPDDQLGSVDDFNHYIRVSRWTLETDSCGHRHLTEHGSEDEAIAWWRTLEAEYDEWCGDRDDAEAES